MKLELDDVSLRVNGQMHIHPTRLELEPGGINVLLGTTLAGKTTLMRLMAGLVRPTAGRLRFGGRDVTGVGVQRRNVSMVYQQFINYPNASVFDNIASPLRVAGVARADIDARVSEVVRLLRLEPFLARRPAELSGGQQQRCALARALVKESDLILLDEPLANLDYKLREELREELPQVFARRPCIVVYATTEPSEALLLGGHTATLHEGRVTQFGPSAQIYRRPADLASARVFSDPPINTVPVRKRGSRFELEGHGSWDGGPTAAALADGEYEFGVRPHHVLVRDADAAHGLAIEGTVQVTEISGSESTVHFELAGRSWVSLSHGVRAFAVGERARFAVDTAHGLLFGPDGSLAHAWATD